MKTNKAFNGIALVSLLAAGCSAGEVCKELARCGGPALADAMALAGPWAKKPDAPYCQERVYTPPPDYYLLNQPVPLARIPLPEATNLDWCSSLVIKPEDPKGVKSASYYLRDLPLSEARFVYKPKFEDPPMNTKITGEGTFDIGFARRARFTQHYSRTCITQYGYRVDCPALALQLGEHNMGNPAVSKFECASDDNPNKDEVGCNCSFQYEEISVLAGFYTLEGGGVITHYPQSPSLRLNRTGFCVNGDTLQVSGLDNGYLMERTGLRTMELARVNCSDGKPGLGEGGVDCGELCPTPCPAPP